MNKKVKLFVVYFPVILIAGQVLVNLSYFVANKFYMNTGFYLNTFFGTNLLFAVFLVAFTYMFKFCTVSRWTAIAELAFAANYMIVKQDNLYNILFQIIVGALSLILTFWYYIKKFPFCKLSLIVNFLESVMQKRSCEKGIDHWKDKIKHYHANSGNRL